MEGRVATLVVYVLAVVVVCQSSALIKRGSCDEESGFQVVSTNKNSNVQETRDGKIVTDTVTTVWKKGNCSSGTSAGHVKHITMGHSEDSNELETESTPQNDQKHNQHHIKHHTEHHIKHSGKTKPHHGRHRNHGASTTKHHNKHHSKEEIKSTGVGEEEETHQTNLGEHEETEANSQGKIQPTHSTPNSLNENTNEPTTQMVFTNNIDQVQLLTYYVAEWEDETRTGQINCSYKLFRGSKVVTEKSYIYPLVNGTRQEVSDIFETKRAFFEKRYWMHVKLITREHHEEKYSYLLKLPGQIEVFYEKYTDGELVKSDSKTYPISDSDTSQTSTLKVLMQFRDYVIDKHKRAGPGSVKFSFSTRHGTLIGENIEYSERISYTSDWRGFLTVFYKLYNSEGRLVFRKAKTSIQRSGKQHEIDKYVRRVMDSVHNGKEYSETEIAGNGTYREKFVYRPGDEALEIVYSLYKHGKLVHRDEASFPGVPNSQIAVSNVLNHYINTVHKKRQDMEEMEEIEDEERDGKIGHDLDDETDQAIDFKQDFIIHTTYGEIVGTGLKFKEVFSYTVDEDEVMTASFHLINTNGRSVFSDTKKYSLLSNDQSYIDLHMSEFIKRVHAGFKEVQVEGDTIANVVEIEHSEKVHYVLGPTSVTLTYKYLVFGRDVISETETIQTTGQTQRVYDQILYSFVENLHRRRDEEHKLLTTHLFSKWK